MDRRVPPGRRPSASRPEPAAWAQGRKHWTLTTTLSVIGTVVGVLGLVVAVVTNWDKIFEPDPSVTMKHEDFAKLSYGEQIDLCVPYLKDNLESQVEVWRQDIDNHYKGTIPESSDGVAGLDDVTAGGQSIMHLHYAVFEIARKSANADLGLNLVSCADAPTVTVSANMIVGNGSSAPFASARVLAESRTYEGPVFAGVSTAGMPSKIVEFEPYSGAVEYQFSLISGMHHPDRKMWAVTRVIAYGDPNWISELSKWPYGG